ncbi:hypothetical protein D3C81_1207950 [compost metagenome]
MQIIAGPDLIQVVEGPDLRIPGLAASPCGAIACLVPFPSRGEYSIKIGNFQIPLAESSEKLHFLLGFHLQPSTQLHGQTAVPWQVYVDYGQLSCRVIQTDLVAEQIGLQGGHHFRSAGALVVFLPWVTPAHVLGRNAAPSHQTTKQNDNSTRPRRLARRLYTMIHAQLPLQHRRRQCREHTLRRALSCARY